MKFCLYFPLNSLPQSTRKFVTFNKSESLYIARNRNNFQTGTKWRKLLKAFHVGTIKNKVIRLPNTATAIFMSKATLCTEINKNAM